MSIGSKYTLLLLAGVLALAGAVSVEKGWITLQTRTGEGSQRHKVDLSSSLKQVLNLTQSSIIKIESKITFSTEDFLPEFFAFRLRHQTFESVSEPVLAVWREDSESFEAVLDLGDPKQIKHLSGEYRLEVIISDDRLGKQIRKYIANAVVNFRYSLTQPQPTELHYQVPSIIMTEAPPTRIDPPKTFTIFVTLVIIALFALFLYGLHYQKVNLSLLPGDGPGLLLNLFFLLSLGGVLYMLFQFWLNWTFIETFQYFSLVILPFALAANYAFVHIGKE